MLYRMPSEVALPVVFTDDFSQEELLYTGETIVTPCEPSNEADQPVAVTKPTRIDAETERTTFNSVAHDDQPSSEKKPAGTPAVKECGNQIVKLCHHVRGRRGGRSAKKPSSSSSRSCPSSSSADSLAWSSPVGVGSGLTPSSATIALPVPKTSADVSAEQPSTSKCDFAFTPTVNFISESNPAVVFRPPQTSAAGKEPLSTLSVSEGRQIRDALLVSIVKCMQVQNSLHRLLLLKVQAHVTAAAGQTDADSQCSGPSLVYKDPSTERQRESVNDDPGAHHTESATQNLRDAPNAPSVENVDASLSNETKVYTMKIPTKGLHDNPSSSSVNSTEACPGDVHKAPSRKGTGKSLEPYSPTSLSMDSAGDNLNDVSKASSIWCTGDSLNDVPKAPSKGTTEESLEDAPEAVCVETTVNRNNGTPRTSSVGAELKLSDALKGPKTDRSRNDVPRALLSDLQQPLEALMKCVDIQKSLFQRLMAVNLTTAEETTDLSSEISSLSDNQELHVGGQVNMLVVQSKLEAITLKTKIECDYARNPFTNQHLKPSTSEDVIQRMSVDKRPFGTGADGGVSSPRELPHGRGILESATGEFIYSGDWREGKRHGKGEGLIFTNSTSHNGFYIGRWKHNMRHGHGKMMFYSGAVYEGQWQFDKVTGYGTLKRPDGTIQEGTWKEGYLNGCALFTWPHGVTEYREHDANRGQLSSSKVGKETAEKLSQLSSFRSKMLNLRECVNELKDEKHFLAEQLNALKMEHAEVVSKFHTFALEIRKNFEEQWERESQKQREEFDKVLKAAEESQSKNIEETEKLKKELEETKEALLCQICFERRPDCIILPCSHLLYCRECVTKHKKGDSRCPTCRGPINSEISINVQC